jgi:hypothetical protein
MNSFFTKLARSPDQIPSRAYGRLDHIELPIDGGNMVLLTFDLIESKWIDERGENDAKFNLLNLATQMAAWQNWSQNLIYGEPIESLFEKAPIFRLEVELSLKGPWFGSRVSSIYDADENALDDQLAALEAEWFQFSLSPTNSRFNGNEALLYFNMFGEPLRVFVTGGTLPASTSAALSMAFSLDHFKKVSTSEIAQWLSKAKADYLAVYDVGQGNSNALLGADGSCRYAVPTLYYDLGKGVGRNSGTTPGSLEFCFTKVPDIVLSHWDSDHWAGACIPNSSGSYPALALRWIAPNQKVGTSHIVFAHDVIANSGKLYIYSASPGTVVVACLSDHRQIKVAVGTGSDRNNSGIVLAIENAARTCSWLLTGDCDYKYFLATIASAPPIGLVVPHHGGASCSKSSPPAPFIGNGNYRRAVYSFGPNNKHGSTGVTHPTWNSVNSHTLAGWDHGTWSSAGSQGYSVPGNDVRATCTHSASAHMGGVLIGWNSKPSIFSAPCIGHPSFGCTTTPTQS